MNLSFHINFNGNCQQAFDYYTQHLGGKPGTLLHYKNSPAAANVSSDWQDKVVHANVNIAGIELAGADVVQYEKPKGFYLLLGVKSEKEVLAIFDKLSVDGEVLLSPQKTFWSRCYAIVIDQFGVPWKINCGD